MVGIYMLHLFCFEVLMAVPYQSAENPGKPLFVRHNKIPKRASHPAVSYYNLLSKEGNSSLRIISIATPVTTLTSIIKPFSVSEFPVLSAAINTCWIPEFGEKVGRFIAFRFIII